MIFSADTASLLCSIDFHWFIEHLNAASFCEWFFSNASYLFVFIFMAVESSFIPFPSEVVVPPAVFVGYHEGNMNVFLIVLVATAGALVGATVNYLLSLWLGRPIIYRFANSRLGHICLIDEAKVKKSEAYFDKHGAASTFIGRLIPAVRQLISIPAGLARMNFAKFAIFTGLGAMVWNGILAVIGYILARNFDSKEAFMDKVEQYNSYLTYAGLALLVFCIGFIIYKGVTAKKAKPTPED